MILLHISNRIQQPAGPQHIRILGIQSLGDNPRLVLARFEVRVWEADEDLGELVSGEEVGEEFHRVAAYCGDVFVAACHWGERFGGV